MKPSNFLLKSGIAIVLALTSHIIFSRSKPTPTETLRKIELHTLAAVKSAQLAIERSSSSHLREIAQRLLDDLAVENDLLGKIYREENQVSPGIASEIESLKFIYDYNEESPFDIAYTLHQLYECKKILPLLQRAMRLPHTSFKETALRNISIFSHYQSELNGYRENFLSVDEYRIRDIAHQIWEAEGRPEGEDKRHWRLAVELLNGISPADLQLAFEQKRSLMDMFSTAPNAGVNKTH